MTRKLNLCLGWIRLGSGGNCKHIGDFNPCGWWNTVLLLVGVDENSRWRRGWQAPADHGCREGWKAVHLQGTSWGQEMVQGCKEVCGECS